MKSIYTFCNTPEGRELRDRLAQSNRESGFEVREFEEQIVITILKLEVTGKRKGEGDSARAVKEQILNTKKSCQE